MFSRKMLWLSGFLAVSPVWLGLIFWHWLPDRLPVHFAGVIADGYEDKRLAIFTMAGLFLLAQLVLTWFIKCSKLPNRLPALAYGLGFMVPVLALSYCLLIAFSL